MILDEIEENQIPETRNKRYTKIVLTVISLLPILLWPLIFFVSIFIFDDPNANPTHQYLIFYGINAYPLYLIINTLIANRIFNKNNGLGAILFLWPLIVVILFLCWITIF